MATFCLLVNSPWSMSHCPCSTKITLYAHYAKVHFVPFQCALANPCYEPSKCENLSPGYRCGGCPTGYRGNAPSGVGLEHAQKYKQKCDEIDECAEGVDTCDPNSNCINTPVSAEWSPSYLHFGLWKMCRMEEVEMLLLSNWEINGNVSLYKEKCKNIIFYFILGRHLSQCMEFRFWFLNKVNLGKSQIF